MPPQIVRSEEPATAVACDALVIGATSTGEGPCLQPGGNDVDAALDGYLTEYLDIAGFRGKRGELEMVATARRLPAHAVAVVGLGSADELDASAVRAAAGFAARKLSQRSVLASILHEATKDGLAAAVEGFLLGNYIFTGYKSDPASAKTATIMTLGNASDDEIERGQIVSAACVLARDLTNEPASTLSPEVLAARAREIADVAGLECTIHDERELSRRGFGGILGVSQGSARPPRLIELRYSPPGERPPASARVAILGKGITFDSGGLSIKDARSMETMKTDMAGGAAVIATMSALGRLRPNVEVLALVPTAENMNGDAALKPGDVLTHYGGRTTEVNNTDAEGRLVLGDAIAYACESEPSAVVDVATLTGGVVLALGRRSTGLFSNDDRLAEELERAGASAGERLWRLPAYDDYLSYLESEVADMKNSGGRFGAAIFGAIFLKQFLSPGTAWAHLDIAWTARAESDSGETSRGGTGVGVRTLLHWIEGREA